MVTYFVPKQKQTETNGPFMKRISSSTITCLLLSFWLAVPALSAPSRHRVALLPLLTDSSSDPLKTESYLVSDIIEGLRNEGHSPISDGYLNEALSKTAITNLGSVCHTDTSCILENTAPLLADRIILGVITNNSHIRWHIFDAISEIKLREFQTPLENLIEPGFIPRLSSSLNSAGIPSESESHSEPELLSLVPGGEPNASEEVPLPPIRVGRTPVPPQIPIEISHAPKSILYRTGMGATIIGSAALGISAWLRFRSSMTFNDITPHTAQISANDSLQSAISDFDLSITSAVIGGITGAIGAAILGLDHFQSQGEPIIQPRITPTEAGTELRWNF